MRDTKNDVGREGVTHLIIADNCSLVPSKRQELPERTVDATVELRRRGLEWKREELEFVSRRSAGEDAGCICFDYGEQHYEVQEVKQVKAMECSDNSWSRFYDCI